MTEELRNMLKKANEPKEPRDSVAKLIKEIAEDNGLYVKFGWKRITYEGGLSRQPEIYDDIVFISTSKNMSRWNSNTILLELYGNKNNPFIVPNTSLESHYKKVKKAMNNTICPFILKISDEGPYPIFDMKDKNVIKNLGDFLVKVTYPLNKKF